MRCLLVLLYLGLGFKTNNCETIGFQEIVESFASSLVNLVENATNAGEIKNGYTNFLIDEKLSFVHSDFITMYNRLKLNVFHDFFEDILTRLNKNLENIGKEVFRMNETGVENKTWENIKNINTMLNSNTFPSSFKEHRDYPQEIKVDFENFYVKRLANYISSDIPMLQDDMLLNISLKGNISSYYAVLFESYTDYQGNLFLHPGSIFTGMKQDITYDSRLTPSYFSSLGTKNVLILASSNFISRMNRPLFRDAVVRILDSFNADDYLNIFYIQRHQNANFRFSIIDEDDLVPASMENIEIIIFSYALADFHSSYEKYMSLIAKNNYGFYYNVKNVDQMITNVPHYLSHTISLNLQIFNYKYAFIYPWKNYKPVLSISKAKVMKLASPTSFEKLPYPLVASLGFKLITFSEYMELTPFPFGAYLFVEDDTGNLLFHPLMISSLRPGFTIPTLKNDQIVNFTALNKSFVLNNYLITKTLNVVAMNNKVETRLMDLVYVESEAGNIKFGYFWPNETMISNEFIFDLEELRRLLDNTNKINFDKFNITDLTYCGNFFSNPFRPTNLEQLLAIVSQDSFGKICKTALITALFYEYDLLDKTTQLWDTQKSRFDHYLPPFSLMPHRIENLLTKMKSIMKTSPTPTPPDPKLKFSF
ncbi:hypothetical protein RF11_08727 [Thelohanellus kitauei]|uniref:Uncharacterized protein n=1 Tax=Thelohanellus kitauei TaxID=669202 RepID=A0A0C2J3J5_THEKT|nr:hypothetical protein RF11_08727 [Thelohanellus kitauei]